MLGTRIVTALILAPAVLAAVVWLPLDYLAAVFWCIVALGCYEWSGLAGLQGYPGRMAYVGVFGGFAWLLYGQQAFYNVVLLGGCTVWLLAAGAVLLFPRGGEIFRNRAFVAALGQLVLIPAWLGLVVVKGHENGYLWLIWVFFLVWGADIGAFFAGRAFGRRKLAPAVSPGKTWEGAVGGFLLAGVVGAAGVYWLAPDWLMWLPFIAALIVVSVFGDLFESILKRVCGVKDSGGLLPGHGGVLDRIDSLLAVMPVFAVFLLWN